MAYVFKLTFAGDPSPLVLRTALNALAQSNAEWYLAEWEDGRDPPASALEAGVRHVAYRGAPAQKGAGAPQVFRAGKAECGPIAAVWAGYLQAAARWHGMSAEEAADLYTVELEVSADPGGQTLYYWHAVVQTPDGIFDVTKGMRT